MKKIFTKLMLLAVAATALASCANDDINDVQTLGGIDVTINASIEETRSHFGDYNATDKTYPTLWDGNEDWYVAINGGHAKANVDDGELTYNDDKTGATVNMEIKNVGTTSPYTLYALSPATAFTSYAASNYYRLKIGNSQTPSATSCDPAAQILIAQSEPQEDATSFNVTFKHATAYAKFSFVNLNLEGATVNNVSVESEVPFAGTFDYKFADKGLAAATASSTITLNTTATENLWLACAPVDLQGKKLTFTINTTNGPLTKEVAMPTGKGEFKPGVVATFNINMEGIEFEKSVKYELVTDASELAVGDEIIIAAKTANYAISTTQKSNNRAATAIVKDGNYIVDPGTDVQIITVESGASAGTFAFKVGTQYLYAPGGGNYMRTTSTKNANASWFVTISNGSTSIVADRSGKNVMQYNYNNGSPLFACYDSASQTAVAIYKLPNTKPAIVASNIEVSAEGGDGEATYSVKNMADDVIGEFENDWLTVSAGSGTIMWEATANYSGQTRDAEVVLTSASTGATKTITVTQAADQFKVSATAITLDAEKGAKATFTVTSSYDYSVSNPDSSKLSVVKGDNGVITVTALTANELAEALSIGNIVVSRSVDTKTLNVAVSQKAAEQGGDEPEPEVAGYKKVTAVTSGKKYLIVAGGLSTVMIPKSGSSKFNSTSVTINNGVIASNATVDAYAVTITASGSGYKISFLNGSTTTYVYYNSSTNLGTGTSTNKLWKIAAATKAGTFAITDSSTTNRGLIFRKGSYNQFGGYATSNINGSEYYNVDLYELQ